MSPAATSEQFAAEILDADDPTRRSGPLPTYQDLISRAENEAWSAEDVDFRIDGEQWAAADDGVREEWYRLGCFAGFYQGEVSVVDSHRPFLDAVSDADQRSFLETQAADEDRHV